MNAFFGSGLVDGGELVLLCVMLFAIHVLNIPGDKKRVIY